ncbi:MAG: HD domain-containing protein, partial [Caldisericia bacterium]|nr:HD domain-containing protein [Caldisericia bacterium]
ENKLNEKDLKENEELTLNKLEKEKVLIKKSKNLLNFKYSISFPLKHDKELIGFISFLSNKTKSINRQNLLFLKEISNDLNLGISKFLDKEMVMKKTKEQEKTIDLMLKAFSKIITMKEPYTGDHSSRVSIITYLIGKELNLNKESLKALKYASFLHDLGKLFVPSEILNKYGKLSEREFSLIKEHVLKSYEIVKDINLPEPTEKIILQHHERLDGSGYPYGLKNDEIILEAKILAVADVIDAMLSNRPYRPPLEKEKVIEELTINKGILYDEKVVDIALKIINKIKYN